MQQFIISYVMLALGSYSLKVIIYVRNNVN